MVERPDYLAAGEIARLLPVVPESSREVRATSIILSAIMSVKPFAQRVLEPIGVRVGKTTKAECFTEIVLRNAPAKSKDRPDGLIIVSTGRRTWRALIEAKSGNATINRDQVELYAKLAKQNGFDAVITISNQFSALPTHHPTFLSKAPIRGIQVYHWSWTYLLTEATLTVSEGEFDSSEQRYILSEVVRFLRHPNSGVSRFDRMNSEWRDLVSAIQNGAAVSPLSPETRNSVASWHQEQKDICLLLSRRVGRLCRIKLSRAHGKDAEQRLSDESSKLVQEKQLSFKLEVPDTAADIEVTADVLRRNIVCSCRLKAPLDKKKTPARINWLLRQLRSTPENGIIVRAYWPNTKRFTQEPLAKIREDTTCLHLESPTGEVSAFEVLMIRDLAGDFGRTVKFIEHLESLLPEYYEKVVQHLKAWVPDAPKISQPENRETLAESDTNKAATSALDGNRISAHNVAADTPSSSTSVAEDLSVETVLKRDTDELVDIPWFLKR